MSDQRRRDEDCDAIAVLAFAASYELALQRVTGTSFVSAYFSTQVGCVLDSETSAWLTKASDQRRRDEGRYAA